MYAAKTTPIRPYIVYSILLRKTSKKTLHFILFLATKNRVIVPFMLVCATY